MLLQEDFNIKRILNDVRQLHRDMVLVKRKVGVTFEDEDPDNKVDVIDFDELVNDI